MADPPLLRLLSPETKNSRGLADGSFYQLKREAFTWLLQLSLVVSPAAVLKTSSTIREDPIRYITGRR
jgi:hypothetical protein